MTDLAAWTMVGRWLDQAQHVRDEPMGSDSDMQIKDTLVHCATTLARALLDELTETVLEGRESGKSPAPMSPEVERMLTGLCNKGAVVYRVTVDVEADLGSRDWMSRESMLRDMKLGNVLFQQVHSIEQLTLRKER